MLNFILHNCLWLANNLNDLFVKDKKLFMNKIFSYYFKNYLKMLFWWSKVPIVIMSFKRFLNIGILKVKTK